MALHTRVICHSQVFWGTMLKTPAFPEVTRYGLKRDIYVLAIPMLDVPDL